MRLRGPGRWVVAGLLLVVLLLLVVSALVYVLRSRGLGTAASWAQLASIPLAAVPVLQIAAAAWRTPKSRDRVATPEQVEQAHEILSSLVLAQWRQEARIRRLDDPAPLAVSWQMSDGSVMDHQQHIAAQGHAWSRPLRFVGRSDDVESLVEAFRMLSRRRLVIVGDAGMGKTTLAVLMLRELLETRRDREPTPVIFTLAGWAPETMPFSQWLTERIEQAYPALRAESLGPAAVSELVRHQRILPILDGLDEIPTAQRSRMINALNTTLTRNDQIILLCRSDEYVSAVTGPGGDVLTAAAVIEAQPLTREAVHAYLNSSLPPRPRRSWSSVLNVLATEPTAPLTQALSTPLVLWLLRSVYIDAHGDPAILLESARFPTSDSIVEHLFDHLIPAVLTTATASGDDAPFRVHRHWPPEQASRCLGLLAWWLERSRTSDLAWWRLWTSLPRYTMERMTAVTAGIIAGLSFASSFGLFLWATGYTDRALDYGVRYGVGYGLAHALTYLIAFKIISYASRDAGRNRGRTRWHAIGHAIAAWTAIWLVGALVFGPIVALEVALTTKDLDTSLTAALVAVLTVGLSIGLVRIFSTDPDIDPVHTRLELRGRWVSLLAHLSGWFIGGLAFGSAVGMTTGFALHVQYAAREQTSLYTAGDVPQALPVGFTIGLISGFVGIGLGFLTWSRRPQMADSIGTPVNSLRRDLRITAIDALVSALVIATIYGVTYELTYGQRGYGSGIPFGLAFGLSLGIIAKLRSSTPIYLITVIYLGIRFRTPFRVMHLLQDAHRLGLIRQNGSFYQFRHITFQRHLARTFNGRRAYGARRSGRSRRCRAGRSFR